MWKTPSFWYQKPKGYARVVVALLVPVSWLFLLAGYLRNLVAGLKLSSKLSPEFPVVLCVGNVVAGGAGKTPMAIALAEQLKDWGVRPFFISRGYGGKNKKPLRVKSSHMAWQVGDEPLLLARHGPVWIARNPRHALQSACHDGARLVIADDGMQNPLLKKSFHILVVNGASGFGNGFLLPAGPLRETPARAVKRAAVVVVIAPENSRANEDSRGEKNPSRASNSLPSIQALASLCIRHKTPLVRAVMTCRLPAACKAHKNVIAFAGLAMPQRFFDMVESMGKTCLEKIAFGDHKPYTEASAQRLLALARRHQAPLLTTEKDRARLQGYPATSLRHQLFQRALAIPIEITVKDTALWHTVLRTGLAHKGLARTGLAPTSSVSGGVK